MQLHPITTALAASLALATAHTHAAGPISLTDVNDVYSQSFDSLARTGTTQAWTNGTTLDGWYLFNGVGNVALTRLEVGDGNNIGGVHSVGASGSSERALGPIARVTTGVASGVRAVAFLGITNNTPQALTAFTLQYDTEQWRVAGLVSISTIANTQFSYRVGTSLKTAPAGYTRSTLLDMSPLVNDGTARKLDGNAAANRRAVAGTVTLDWATGQTLWLRWEDRSFGQTDDHMLAIDNLRFSVTPIPEPGTWALMLAGLGCVGFLARRRAG